MFKEGFRSFLNPSGCFSSLGNSPPDGFRNAFFPGSPLLLAALLALVVLGPDSADPRRRLIPWPLGSCLLGRGLVAASALARLDDVGMGSPPPRPAFEDLLRASPRPPPPAPAEDLRCDLSMTDESRDLSISPVLPLRCDLSKGGSPPRLDLLVIIPSVEGRRVPLRTGELITVESMETVECPDASVGLRSSPPPSPGLGLRFTIFLRRRTEIGLSVVDEEAVGKTEVGISPTMSGSVSNGAAMGTGVSIFSRVMSQMDRAAIT